MGRDQMIIASIVLIAGCGKTSEPPSDATTVASKDESAPDRIAATSPAAMMAAAYLQEMPGTPLTRDWIVKFDGWLDDAEKAYQENRGGIARLLINTAGDLNMAKKPTRFFDLAWSATFQPPTPKTSGEQRRLDILMKLYESERLNGVEHREAYEAAKTKLK